MTLNDVNFLVLFFPIDRLLGAGVSWDLLIHVLIMHALRGQVSLRLGFARNTWVYGVSSTGSDVAHVLCVHHKLFPTCLEGELSQKWLGGGRGRDLPWERCLQKTSVEWALADAGSGTSGPGSQIGPGTGS